LAKALWTPPVEAVNLEGMRSIFVCSTLSLSLLLAPMVVLGNDGAVLARLEFSNGILGGLFAQRASISATPGTNASPFAGKALASWLLREGDTLHQLNQPPQQFIRFYRVNGPQVDLICSIIVKYTLDSGGWRPAYQMLQEPRVTYNGQNFLPIPNSTSARGILQVLQASDTTAEGFSHNIRFGYTSAPTTIDAWVVQ
jgi:hypothetical protein